jgi:hypothetical protein
MPTKKQEQEAIDRERFKEVLERVSEMSGVLLGPDLMTAYKAKYDDDLSIDIFVAAWFKALNDTLHALWKQLEGNKEARTFLKKFVMDNFTQVNTAWYGRTATHRDPSVPDTRPDEQVETGSVSEVGGQEPQEDSEETPSPETGA